MMEVKDIWNAAKLHTLHELGEICEGDSAYDENVPNLDSYLGKIKKYVIIITDKETKKIKVVSLNEIKDIIKIYNNLMQNLATIKNLSDIDIHKIHIDKDKNIKILTITSDKLYITLSP